MQNVFFKFISKYISLSEDEKLAIEALNIFHNLKKGTIILKEGKYSNESYLVLQGCIRTYYFINGEEKTTAFYTGMEGFTPSCVLTKTLCEHFISCVEETDIIIFNTDKEAEIFRKFPKLQGLYRIGLEHLLAKSQFSFDQFKTSSPEQRYINLIKNRPDLLKRVPQHQLANYLGVTPQSLSRIRARICQSPLI